MTHPAGQGAERPKMTPRPSDVASVEVDQVWRRKSTGDRYVCTKAGPVKATLRRQTKTYSEKITVWVELIVNDPDWEEIAGG